MISNYLRLAFRNLLKHRGYTSINIFGLALGMMVFLLIAQYVEFERSYESFLPNADHIYRVTLERYLNNELQIASAENFPGVGPAMQEELPEVVSYARLYNMGYKNNVIITNRDASPEPIAFKQRRFMYADSAFLGLMGYEMLKGDPTTALAEPLKAVISEEYATKYFGAADPMGKSLLMQDDDFNNELVEVTGVFKNLPANTHLKFDVLFSYRTLYGRFERAPQRYGQSWDRKDMYTFVQLREGTDPKLVEAALPGIVEKYSPKLAENNRRDVLALQPLRSIHLTSDLAEEPEPNGDQRIVFFMSLIGIFVILIAWINYINLSTARAVERGREVGVRKVVGAEKSQLISQFLVEAALVNLMAMLLAFGLTVLVLPWFNQISGLALKISFLLQPWFLGLLAGLWVVGTLLSGFYPALVLSSFKPIAVLKGQLKNTARGVLLRKGLVVTQFMASVVLIVATFVIYNQLNFMLQGDMGMNIDQVLVVERPGISEKDRNAYNSSIDVFRAELLKDGDIEAVSASLTVPGKQREYKGTIKRFGAPDNNLVSVRINSMDYDFLNVFKMEMVAGRGFSKDFISDQDTAIILTESASQLLGFAKPEDAIGQTLTAPDWQWNPIVVGVVNDYHQVSLKKALEPSAFFCSPYSGEFYSMRVKTNNLSKTLAHAEEAWSTAFPGNPFEHFFLDDYFNRQYENEQRFAKLTTIFALLAIIVGCLGLFGLSGFTITQRTKEIGIRKVLGASTGNIVTLLSKDFLQLVLVAILVAIPIAWWVMSNWLNSFANRIDLHWWIFALAGVVAVLIAFLTVSFQSVKAALSNPVESIRTE